MPCCCYKKGGREVYLGPLGLRGTDVVRFLEAAVEDANPIAPPSVLDPLLCPAGTNPASWQLEVLSLGIARGVGQQLPQTVSPASGDSTPAPAIAEAAAAVEHSAAASGSVAFVDFPAFYKASPLYADNQRKLAALCQPEPGSQPVRLDSTYARSFPDQLWFLLQRTSTAYWRNVPYLATRIMVLAVLAIVFGAVYWQTVSSDITGIIGKISVIFLGSAFNAIISFGTPLPVLERERPMVYRERHSRMYDSVAYSLAMAIVEIPWTGFISLLSTTILYFMVGLKADASTFFHYWFVNFQLSLNYLFVGQWFAFGFPSVQVAQATGGTIVSIQFLLAGLFAPAPRKCTYVYDPWRLILRTIQLRLIAVYIPPMHTFSPFYPLQRLAPSGSGSTSRIPSATLYPR